MSRLPNQEGGWFKLWGKKWLTDEKLKEIGDIGEISYLRILCLSNVLMVNGEFKDRLGIPYKVDYLCESARITRENFDLLLKYGFIRLNGDCYCIVTWNKHQPRVYKKFDKPIEMAPKQPSKPGIVKSECTEV